MKKELLNALLAVQKDLPVVGKSETADAGKFKYKYAPIDQVWEKIGDILTKHGFAITNKVTEGGVKTTAWHEHGELFSYISFSNLDLKPQDKGSEITYARRYNLTAIFNVIVAGEDDDAGTAQKATQKPSAPFSEPSRRQVKQSTNVAMLATPAQVKAVYAIGAKKKIDMEGIKSKLGIESLNEMTRIQASKFIEQFGDTPKSPDIAMNEDVDFGAEFEEVE